MSPERGQPWRSRRASWFLSTWWFPPPGHGDPPTIVDVGAEGHSVGECQPTASVINYVRREQRFFRTLGPTAATRLTQVMTFTTTNWNTDQYLTIIPIQDSNANDETGEITAA